MDSQDSRSTAINQLSHHEAELLTKVIDHVRDYYPTYVVVSDDLLQISFRQNIEMSVRAVSNAERPRDAELRSYAQIARRRFELGVPIDDLIRSYRFSIGLIADTLTDLFEDYDVSPVDSLQAYRRIWNVSDAYTAVLVEVYRQHQLQLDTRNHEIKMDFIERLRTGNMDEATLNSAHTRFHLRPSIQYRAFFATLLSGSDHDLYSLMVTLEPQLIGHRGVCAIRGDMIVGICSSSVDVGPKVSVSYGQLMPLAEIADSFATAERVVTTSIASLPGHHDLDEVGWRVSVLPVAPLLLHFESCFRRPLEEAKVDSRTVLDSVREYIKQNRSYRIAAKTLHCHPNTLRYRIARFEQITGFRVDDTETIVSLQWWFEAKVRNTSTKP